MLLLLWLLLVPTQKTPLSPKFILHRYSTLQVHGTLRNCNFGAQGLRQVRVLDFLTWTCGLGMA